MKKAGYTALVKFVEENVSWQGGSESAWACDAIIGAQFLANLAGLAAQAPVRQRELFLQGINIVEFQRED